MLPAHDRFRRAGGTRPRWWSLFQDGQAD